MTGPDTVHQDPWALSGQQPVTTELTIRVLGAGCARCRALTARTQAVLDDLGIDATVEVVDDPWVIAGYGVMRIPALVIDNRPILVGNVPRSQKLRTLIQGAISP